MKPRIWLLLPALLLLLAACDSIFGPDREVKEVVRVAGNAQVDTVGATLAAALVVEVRDQDGQPYPGRTVLWEVLEGDATATPVEAVTDDAGRASTTIRLGTTAGPVEVFATVGKSQVVGFTLRAVPDRAARVVPSEAVVVLDALEATYALDVAVEDRHGNELASPELAWSSSDESIVSVAADGTLRAESLGDVTLTIVSDTARAEVPVLVDQAPALIEVTPGETVFTAVGDSAQLSAAAFDRNGFPIDGVAFSWRSGDEDRAVVSETGLVESRGAGAVDIFAGAGDAEGGALVRVAQVATRLEVAPDSQTIVALEDTVRFVATGYDRNDFPVTDAAPEWSTSNADVAVVDEHGVVTGRKPGAVTVQASLDGLVAAARAAVSQRADSVALSVDEATLTAIDDTLRLTAAAFDRNGFAIEGAVFEWSSGDTDVATTSATGTVTARGPGETQVSAAAEDGYASAVIRVEQAPSSITFSPAELVVPALEDTARLAAAVLDANGHAIAGAPVAWASGDSTLVTVSGSGLVTSRQKQGSTTVSATAGAVTASANVTVDQAAARIEVTPAELAFTAVADTARLSAVAYDRKEFLIADAVFAWSSEDAGVASVDASGLVTSQGGGTVEVTASADGAAAAATVDVHQIATSLSITPNPIRFTAIGQSIAIKPTAKDANGHAIVDDAFTWSTSDAGVVEVGAKGVAISRAAGSTRIQVARDGLEAEAEAVVSQTLSRIVVATPTDTLREPGDTLRMRAVALDRNGNEIPGFTFNWRSLETSIVTVDATGLVTAQNERGTAGIVASSSGVEDRAMVTRIPWGRLVLTFDDVFADHFTRVKPILDDLGLRGNLAVPTGWVDDPGRLTTAQVRTFYNDGWGIVSHSVTHSDLRYLNDVDLGWELKESQRWVRDVIGPGGEDVFVVPFHRWADGEAAEIRKYYKATRGYGTDHSSHGGMIDWPPVDPHALTSIPADGMLTSAGLDALEAMWIEAIHQGKFVGTYFHSVSAADEAMFRAAMERLAKYREHLYTYPELF